MIERYTHPEMGRIWTDKHRFEVMLQVEILSCEALAQLGEIPKSAYREIKSKADFNVASIQRIEERTKHDVIAFVTDVAKRIGPAGKYVHKGLTSSDVLDTGLSVQMVEAADLLLANVDKLLSALAKQAVRHKETVMVGRTHGVHAEPTTFGLVLALFYDEIMRQRERLERARETVRVGKISGAVGTYAHLSPRVEAHVCKGLGLKPANISNQVVQRDRHAEYLCTLAVIGGTLDKIALEIRHLQRTEVLEAEEPFAKGQQGSSAMPHKRNPVACERICGMARLLRGNAQVALENQALWHQRDISHSSAERVILPDSTIALDCMLREATRVISGLQVYPRNMLANLERTRGLLFSQQVMLALVGKGVSRQEAYKTVQKSAMWVWKQGGHLSERLLEDPKITQHLTRREVQKCFDLKPHLRHVNRIFKKVGLEDS